MIRIVVGDIKKMTKELKTILRELEIRNRMKTFHTTALVTSAKMFKKSPGEVRRFAVTQTSMKFSQFNVAGKTRIK